MIDNLKRYGTRTDPSGTEKLQLKRLECIHSLHKVCTVYVVSVRFKKKH